MPHLRLARSRHIFFWPECGQPRVVFSCALSFRITLAMAVHSSYSLPLGAWTELASLVCLSLAAC